MFMENVDKELSHKIKEISEQIISSDSQNFSEEELAKLAEKITKKLESSENLHINKVASSMKKSQIGIKHKLKISIPLFLFTNYESEIEVSAGDKIPKNLKDLKSLLIEEK